MNEKYLHFLWKNKRLPFHLLKTIDNQDVQVLDVGVLNTDAGPDFFNGKISLDGIVHSGNIEMHINSSDWNLHGHQFDAAYKNVILHVVYKHDELIFIEGIPIPTIELLHYIDKQHYSQFQRLTTSKTQLACANSIHQVPAPIIWQQVQTALSHRLERKANALNQNSNDIRQVLFSAFAKAFGMKVNALPFEELANHIPFSHFIRASLFEKVSMVLGISGLLESKIAHVFDEALHREWLFQKHKFNCKVVQVESWKYKGCRPKGFPTVRLVQFAHLMHQLDWSTAFWEAKPENLVSDFLKRLTHAHTNEKEVSCPAVSREVAAVICTNSLAPFLWFLGNKNNDSSYYERAILLLELLPKENNSKLTNWKNHGIRPKTAADSQGLIELLDQWCEKKSCLNCVIGSTVLASQ